MDLLVLAWLAWLANKALRRLPSVWDVDAAAWRWRQLRAWHRRRRGLP